MLNVSDRCHVIGIVYNCRCLYVCAVVCMYVYVCACLRAFVRACLRVIKRRMTDQRNVDICFMLDKDSPINRIDWVISDLLGGEGDVLPCERY